MSISPQPQTASLCKSFLQIRGQLETLAANNQQLDDQCTRSIKEILVGHQHDPLEDISYLKNLTFSFIKKKKNRKIEFYRENDMDFSPTSGWWIPKPSLSTSLNLAKCVSSIIRCQYQLGVFLKYLGKCLKHPMCSGSGNYLPCDTKHLH